MFDSRITICCQRLQRGELARDRAQNGDLRALLSRAVNDATVAQEVHFSLNPQARPKTCEAELRRMHGAIMATAEDHRVMVAHQREEDDVSTTSERTSSPEPDCQMDDCGTDLSSVDGEKNPVEDGDAKDLTDVDPESTEKIISREITDHDHTVPNELIAERGELSTLCNGLHLNSDAETGRSLDDCVIGNPHSLVPPMDTEVQVQA